MDKLEELNKKIQDYKKKNKIKRYKKKKIIIGSLNISLEIIGAAAIGVLIGFYLDKFFDLKFFFKVACLILAFIASLVNIYRTLDKH
jgi:F0F1-type ATP synthase assembly protein I